MGSLRELRRNLSSSELPTLRTNLGEEIGFGGLLSMQTSIEKLLDRHRSSLVKVRRNRKVARYFIALTAGLIGLFVGLFLLNQHWYDLFILFVNCISLYMWWGVLSQNAHKESNLDKTINDLLDHLLLVNRQLSVPSGVVPKF